MPCGRCRTILINHILSNIQPTTTYFISKGGRASGAGNHPDAFCHRELADLLDRAGQRGRLEGEPRPRQELRQKLHREGRQGLPHARLPLQVGRVNYIAL